MKSPLRLVGRIAFLLLVFVLLVVGGVLAFFTSWRADKVAELNGASELIETSSGPVECVVRGEGPAVLVFHGTPGGYDQAMLVASGLQDAGFQVIAPSRPGYLRTPLASGLLPDQQADLGLGLLDVLGVQSVAVIGVDGGGPAAIEFALRYPGRTWGLVLLSAVTKRYDPSQKAEKPAVGDLVLSRLTGDVGSWLYVRWADHDPAAALEATLELTSTSSSEERAFITGNVLADAAQTEWFRSLVGTFAPLSPRESGARNDLLNFQTLPDYAWARLTAPTLLIHGTADRNVPLADAQAAAAAIPHAQLLPVNGAGHLVTLGPWSGDVRRALVEFLRKNSGGQAQP